MVLINLKSTLGANNDNDEFLYETKTSTKVDDLIESLVEIHNARFRSCLVADAVKALATYGVAKMPDNDGTGRVRGASTVILLSPQKIFFLSHCELQRHFLAGPRINWQRS